jgi:hypothetical protein
MEKVRKLTSYAHLPILAVSNTTAEMVSRTAAGLVFDDHQLRFEREAMLKSIAQLACAVNKEDTEPADVERTGELLHA